MRFGLLMLFLLASGVASAQTFEGRVLELHTRTGIAGAIIHNLSSGIKEITDTTGQFRIAARVGDLISVQSLGYRRDTLYLEKLNKREIFLSPFSRTLTEVIVRNNSIDTSIKWLDPEFHGQRVKYQRNDDGTYKGGIQISLYHKKDSRRRRAQLRRLENAEMLEEINRLFSPVNVRRYIPLNEPELSNFISLYRPSVKIYQSGNFSFLLYLNDSYKKFLALPPNQRKLPPLPKFNPR